MSSSIGLEIGTWVICLALVPCLFFWFRRDSQLSLNKIVTDTSTTPESVPSTDPDWQQLAARADAIVQAAIAELPDDVRAEAQSVPVLFEERCEDDEQGRTILGIYLGFEANQVSQRKGPIILYLHSIEDYVGTGSPTAAFDDQVRKTYLHELGHHLGWGEIDVRARGL